VPHNPKVRTAATARITPALPRRAPSRVDRLSFFWRWRFHVATSLRKASGANSNRRTRTRRPSCSRWKSRGYNHRYISNWLPCTRRWVGRVVCPCLKGTCSPRWEVPKGTV